MTIINRYILRHFVSNFLIALAVFVFLFLVLDFFDRIDNILNESPTIWLVLQYFLLKVPMTVSLMVPVATLVGTLFTIGLLSRQSEITAMRASGITLSSIGKPLFISAFTLSLLVLLINETLVPSANKRFREIYNIDIKQKDKTGSYSQMNLWWRQGEQFYSISNFNSRTNTLHGVSQFELNDKFEIEKRVDASEASYVDPELGWTMKGVNEYSFEDKQSPKVQSIKRLPLPIRKTPADFYDVETDPTTMSFRQLRKFIRTQTNNGLNTAHYMADLYDKLAFPFITLVICGVTLPFALTPARSGSMAFSILAALVIGFSYYAVHSFSIALGRAEIVSPFLSAWFANVGMGGLAWMLLKGSESPG